VVFGVLNAFTVSRILHSAHLCCLLRLLNNDIVDEPPDQSAAAPIPNNPFACRTALAASVAAASAPVRAASPGLVSRSGPPTMT
jgi:hypothetical protein